MNRSVILKLVALVQDSADTCPTVLLDYANLLLQLDLWVWTLNLYIQQGY